MRHIRLAVVFGVMVFMGALAAPNATGSTTRPAATTREVIAVYLGSSGTDRQSGMITVVNEMKSALTTQAAATDRRFISRGVSLEPSAEAGLRHLALFGHFDELSVGGNWTNSMVVRYLGGTIGQDSTTYIPQVVLLERQVTETGTSLLHITPEREIGRFVGGDAIRRWVRSGAPLPR